MLAISSVHTLALASTFTPSTGVLVVLGGLIGGAAIALRLAWLRVRTRRRDQRRELALQRLSVSQIMEPATAGVPITMTLPGTVRVLV